MTAVEPYPMLGGTPGLFIYFFIYFFFHHNDRKGCKRDYLDDFILHFSAIGDKPLGGGRDNVNSLWPFEPPNPKTATPQKKKKKKKKKNRFLWLGPRIWF